MGVEGGEMGWKGTRGHGWQGEGRGRERGKQRRRAGREDEGKQKGDAEREEEGRQIQGVEGRVARGDKSGRGREEPEGDEG